MAETGIGPALLEQVLERLGLAAAPEPEGAGLRALYAAWCRRVPFDNIAKRTQLAAGTAGPLPGDNPADFFRAWLDDGTGGTCWAGNGALCALLQALGFRARRGLATMLVAPGLPPNHGTVSVELQGERWLVDASMLFGEPLPLREAGARIAHPAWGVELRHEDGAFQVGWRPLHADHLACRIDSLESDAPEFRRYHEGTRGWSPFNYSLSLRLVRGPGVIGAALGQHGEITPAGERRLRPFAPGERTRFLVEEVGVREEVAERLPPEEELPPPGSRTAAGSGLR